VSALQAQLETEEKSLELQEQLDQCRAKEEQRVAEEGKVLKVWVTLESFIVDGLLDARFTGVGPMSTGAGNDQERPTRRGG
jgi:DNA-binding protein H-NS